MPAVCFSTALCTETPLQRWPVSARQQDNRKRFPFGASLDGERRSFYSIIRATVDRLVPGWLYDIHASSSSPPFVRFPCSLATQTIRALSPPRVRFSRFPVVPFFRWRARARERMSAALTTTTTSSLSPLHFISSLFVRPRDVAHAPRQQFTRRPDTAPRWCSPPLVSCTSHHSRLELLPCRGCMYDRLTSRRHSLG